MGDSNAGGSNFPHPFRPALEPTHPPVQLIQVLFPGGNATLSWYPPVPSDEVK